MLTVSATTELQITNMITRLVKNGEYTHALRKAFAAENKTATQEIENAFDSFISSISPKDLAKLLAENKISIIRHCNEQRYTFHSRQSTRVIDLI